MSREYMFNDADNMIDLARDIQSNVYWGGNFYLDDDQINWKYFWSTVEVERAKSDIVGVSIDSNGYVKFLPRRDIE